jgi:tripartite-type tricarboxylate transporter receptor subunit TctC
MIKRTRLSATLVLAFALVAVVRGHALAAEAYPNRPIQVINPAPVGGALDIAFRLIQPQMSTILGTPMIITNRVGASGIVGMEAVATAKPDGYTLAATSTSTITVVNVSAPHVPYKLDDFIPIGNYAFDFTVLAVRADAPWASFEALKTYARQHPGKLSYGSAGAGTLSSLNMEAIKNAFGLDILQVPYAGAPQAVTAVIAKQLDIAAVPLSGAAAMVRNGTLRALVTTATQRLPSFPNIPTLTEQGFGREPLNLAIGLYAPADTPDDVIRTLSSALHQAISTTSIAAAIEKSGMFVQYEDGATVRKRLKDEYENVMDLGHQLNLTH